MKMAFLANMGRLELLENKVQPTPVQDPGQRIMDGLLVGFAHQTDADHHGGAQIENAVQNHEQHGPDNR